MLSVNQAFEYQSSNWSGIVPLNGVISLNALERLPFVLESPLFKQSCNFSRTKQRQRSIRTRLEITRDCFSAQALLLNQQQRQFSSSDSGSLEQTRHVLKQVVYCDVSQLRPRLSRRNLVSVPRTRNDTYSNKTSRASRYFQQYELTHQGQPKSAAQ